MRAKGLEGPSRRPLSNPRQTQSTFWQDASRMGNMRISQPMNKHTTPLLLLLVLGISSHVHLGFIFPSSAAPLTQVTRRDCTARRAADDEPLSFQPLVISYRPQMDGSSSFGNWTPPKWLRISCRCPCRTTKQVVPSKTSHQDFVYAQNRLESKIKPHGP